MIYFVRHGQSQANLQRVYAGQRDDSLLTRLGRKQAQAAGADILKRQFKIDQIISSPLIRASETAKIIADVIGLDSYKIQIDGRLSEYDMGDFSGTPVRTMTPEVLSVPHNEEDPYKFQTRVMEVINSLKLQLANSLVVSHEEVERIIETTRLGLDPRNFYDIQPYSNGQIMELKS